MNGISERIRRHIETRVGVHTAYAREGEARTRIALIDPFLRDVLNYDPSIPTQVVVENIADVRGRGTRNKADYALMQNGQPLVVVEAKSADSSLAGAVEQLNGYLHGTRSARFGICTNGLGYHFYKLDTDKRYMETEPFFTVDLQRGNPAEDSDVAHLLAMFAREDFNPEGIEKWADLRNRRTAIKSRLQEELTNPSDGLVSLLMDKVGAGSDQLDYYTPIVHEVARDFLGLPSPQPQRPATPAAGAPSASTPSAQINAGEVPVRWKYKGAEYNAVLQSDGFVRLPDGTPRAPGGACKAALGKYIHIMGWRAWQYYDEQTGRWKSIKDLPNAADMKANNSRRRGRQP